MNAPLDEEREIEIAALGNRLSALRLCEASALESLRRSLARHGQLSPLSVFADGEQLEGRLRKLAPQVDTQTRNGLAYVDLPRHGSARAGMFAQGEFELGASPALTLPRSAVQVREGFHYVFRVGADARAVQTRVSLGREAGDRVEIVGGLQGAERVVASGVAFLGDMDLVRVVAAP